MGSIRIFHDGSFLTDEAESGGCETGGLLCGDQNITSEKINQISMEFGSGSLQSSVKTNKNVSLLHDSSQIGRFCVYFPLLSLSNNFSGSRTESATSTQNHFSPRRTNMHQNSLWNSQSSNPQHNPFPVFHLRPRQRL